MIAFDVLREFGGNKYHGKIAGDPIKGTTTAHGHDVELGWTAKRADAEHQGTWTRGDPPATELAA